MMRIQIIALSFCFGLFGGNASSEPFQSTSPTNVISAQTPAIPALGFTATKKLHLEYSDSHPGLLSNPLKGLVSFSEDAWAYDTQGLPKSMEFFYLPLSALMKGENAFDWTELENNIAKIASRGNQAVFRIYLDYPHRKTGIPQYLLDAGLVTYAYDAQGNMPTKDHPEVSVIPNYQNPRLVSALLKFVNALGRKYDGDPRVGFVEAGLYGFWGEWHVYNDKDGGESPQWVMEQTDKDKLLSAYATSFSKTRVLARFANSTQDPALKSFFGYHDDSFSYWTIGPQTYHFAIQMKNAGLSNQWQSRPIGGELRPEISTTLWDSWPNMSIGAGQPFEECVRKTHASWIRHAYMFAKKNTVAYEGDPTVVHPSLIQIENAKRGILLLGYTLHISEVSYTRQGNGIRVQVSIENRGVAPFYYDWIVQLAFADANNKILRIEPNTGWKLSQILPESPQKYVYDMGTVPASARKLLLRQI